ncbi:MAG: zinc ribbon domain-containing protein [Anaerostipes faecalis]|nr:zinc ribbon domain-containing protein [Anaerostipes faecalis]
MAFFEQIGKKITNAGQNVAQQTKNFTDVTQLNSAISEREKKISQLFLNVGQMYYEAHKHDPEAQYQEDITEISNLYSEIAQSQEKIKQIKGVVKCPQCGADVPLNAAFCNACGARIERGSAAETNGGVHKICPVCHSTVDPEDSFCNHCGAKIENN